MMTKQLNTAFYQGMAKLFYAIAAADNNVRKSEINKLKEIVKAEWLDVDETVDEFDTDAAFQIEIVFDWLVDNDADSNTCFKEFIEYKNEHTYFFTETVKKLTIKTAHAIAAAFSGKNKSELILLAKLDIALKKT